MSNPEQHISRTRETREACDFRSNLRLMPDFEDPEERHVAEIIQAVQAGESERFSEIVHMFDRQLTSYTIKNLTSKMEDAKDLMQQVWVRVWQALPNFEFHSLVKFRAWLFTITRRLYINFYRREKTRQKFFSPDPLDAEGAAIGAEEEDSSRTDVILESLFPVPDIESVEAIVACIEDARIRKALNEMNPDFRNAVILCDVCDFTYEEIGELMGWKLGTVMSRIYRGRKALREIFEQESL